MATLYVSELEAPITEPRVVKEVLADLGIEFKIWDCTKLPPIHPSYMIVQEAVINAYKDEIDALKAEGGYAAVDVVGLFPNMPNLQELKDKFSRTHYHTEDEIRFCVHGAGIFTVWDDDVKTVKVELTPGDYIKIPAMHLHAFNLTDANTMIAIRLFTNPSGWIANYV